MTSPTTTMENKSTAFYNLTLFINVTAYNLQDVSKNLDIMLILSSIIASVGIAANLSVVFAFLNHKKLRRKIPNMFIINQVSTFFLIFGL